MSKKEVLLKAGTHVCVECLWNDATHQNGCGSYLCDECDPLYDDCIDEDEE